MLDIGAWARGDKAGGCPYYEDEECIVRVIGNAFKRFFSCMCCLGRMVPSETIRDIKLNQVHNKH